MVSSLASIDTEYDVYADKSLDIIKIKIPNLLPLAQRAAQDLEGYV
ncbi:MAG: hypothetical protein AAGA75_06100 [Cyanobacteria bacterium P01_E01_bin.6]